MRTVLSEAEFLPTIASFTRSAFRLELQPEYNEPSETVTVARFIAGDPENPDWTDWWHLVADHAAAGAPMVRIRITDDPAPAYQDWLR
jgi:hypothetical protein